MRVVWLWVALLGCGLVGVAGAADEPKEKPPADWTEYTPMDKVFRVWIPKGGKRTERTETVPVKDLKIRVNILELQTEDKGKLVARTFLLQPPIPKLKGKPKGPRLAPLPNPQALTEAARDIFLKEVKGKVTDETEVSLGDLKGKEYVITINDKRSARTRVYVLGRFLFQVGIVGTKEQVEGKDAGTFLDSFKPTLGE